MKTNLLPIAVKFHKLAAYAQRNGGVWLSAGFGTMRVAARIIADETGARFDDVLRHLDSVGVGYWNTDHWYSELAWHGFHNPMDMDYEYRWAISTIAKSAVRFA